MSKLKDLTGQRFGRLTVVERADDYISPHGRKIVRWKCLCDCGNYIDVSVVHLRQGDTLSCGCLGTERRRAAAQRPKHGLSRSRIYHIFTGMKIRCNNVNAPNYYLYGGRGIKVCDEWMGKDGFVKFYEWALANGYDDSLTIDRVDVNGNYEPSNCRWVDIKTQCNNTRNSVKLTYNGETLTAAQWAERIGRDRHTIYGRLRQHLPIENVLDPESHQGEKR